MSLKNETYESLRKRIITNDLRAGQKLNEKELMREYGIGRTPLREISLELQRNGLIEIIPKLGTRVVNMDLKVLRETVQLRRELEGLAAQLATHKITVDQLARFRQLLDEAAGISGTGHETLQKMSDIDMEIHHMIYAAADNKQLKDIIRILLDKMSMYWFQIGFSAIEFQKQFGELENLYQTMKKGDAAQSSEIMKQHVDHFTQLVKKNIF